MNEVLILLRMSRRAGVPVAWLREQADAGHIPHLKAGTRYLFNVVATFDALATLAARPGRDSGQKPKTMEGAK